jgi:3-deoxy-D-manno-octulosonic-acid transferase
MTVLLGLYRALARSGGPLIAWHLKRRQARGKEDAARIGERFGRPGRPRPPGPLVWLHGASVGEAMSLLVLIERLRATRPSLSLLVTTGTVTSARLLERRLPEGVIHQYIPVDRPAWAASFLDHWRPDLVLWAESEFWPNLIAAIRARDVPLVLVNGRISDRSLARWRRFPGTIRALLGAFSLCLGQSEEDARRLRELGAHDARSTGNLKLAAAPLPADTAALGTLRAALEGRPVWLAASTHAGEEEIAGRVHRALSRGHPGLLTVVVPRHPERGPEIAEALRATGLSVARRAAGEAPTPDVEIYVADTLGELGLFYRLCPIVFVGKSLAASGGQNPLEPARLGCALVHGPRMDNFRAVAEALAAAGAAETVADERALAGAVSDLLSNANRQARMAAAARRVAETEAGVLDLVMAALAPRLDRLTDRVRADAGA